MATLPRAQMFTPSSWRSQDMRAFVEPLFVALTLLGIVGGLLLGRAGAAPELTLAAHLATYFFGGFYATGAIFTALRERRIEVDLLMVLAALGAAYVDAWTEGAILLFLFALSNMLQNYAMRSRRSRRCWSCAPTR
jgi:Cd2+/Zn2+-exporting ATPase